MTQSRSAQSDLSTSGLAHPTSDSRHPAIAVAGGGIIGLSIALRLAEAGCRVDVFDAGSVGSESSWAGAGMLAPGGEVDEESELASLAVTSRQLYRDFVTQLESESGTTIDLQENGGLDLAYSPAELAALDRKAALQEPLGISSRLLSREQVIAFWPRVRREQLVGARFYPNDALVNPRDVLSALTVALRSRGVRLHERVPLESVHVEADQVLLRASGSSYGYDGFVLAMGAWSSKLPVTGVPPFPAAEPVKGHLIAYHQPEQTCSTIVRHGHTYLVQRATGLLIVGASVEKVGFDRTVQPDVVAELERQASLVFPHLAETTPTEVWTGFRPGAERLHLGLWHSSRVALAYGHFRNGILLAPLTARTVASHLTASLQTR